MAKSRLVKAHCGNCFKTFIVPEAFLNERICQQCYDDYNVISKFQEGNYKLKGKEAISIRWS